MQNKNSLLGIAVLLAFIAGIFIARYYYTATRPPVENATVLLEKIRTVCKLVTVEGEFSEIYNYSDYQGYFTLLWDKKALVRVRATVQAGYDLEKMKMEANPDTKTIRITQLPEPQILAIDHSLDYYDISNGLFSSFSPEDYNRINARAKDLIREQAEKSVLLQNARAQGAKTMDIIRFMVENAGWKLELSPAPTTDKN